MPAIAIVSANGGATPRPWRIRIGMKKAIAHVIRLRMEIKISVERRSLRNMVRAARKSRTPFSTCSITVSAVDFVDELVHKFIVQDLIHNDPYILWISSKEHTKSEKEM